MAATKATAPQYIPQEEDPNSPYEGLFHLLRRCIHGHDTTTEAICHYQDVLGHSCEEEHEKAAESGYRETFYRLYEEAYGVVATINFDRKHSRYARELRERVDDLEATCEEQKTYIKVCEAKATDEVKRRGDVETKLRQATEEADRCKKHIHELEDEVIRLKAKLYDMMEEKK